MGYKLLQIMTDGLYAVFHRFDAFLKWLAQFFCDLPSKSLCQAYWDANLSRRGASFGWTRKWPISNEKWAVHF